MKILLYFFMLLLGLVSLRADEPLSDARLLGTWKSNRDLTVEAIRPHLKLPPEKQEIIFNIFGHLQMTYTKDKIEGRLALPDKEPWTFSSTYQILAKTEDTATLREKRVEEGVEKTTEVVLHFVSPDRYWIRIPQNPTVKELDMSEWKEFFDRVNK